MSAVLAETHSHTGWLEPLFDVAFAAPDGIARLRQLILTLAMQGKLVPQLPTNAPAPELLKQIAVEKAALVRAGKIRAPKESNPIADSEKPYTIPAGWEWVRFGDIAQHNSGKTLDGSRNSGQLRDYITTSNLYWGRFQLQSVRQMRIKDDELERCTARRGDLLICEGGEAGRAAVWNFDHEVCFQNHVHRARFYFGVVPEFAYRLFEKLNGSGEIDRYRKGVGISNMSSKALASITFPLPPLEEQKRIVARIDELMSRCDELEFQRAAGEAKRREARVAAVRQWLAGGEAAAALLYAHFADLFANRDDVAGLRKAILQLAVMGKLVPQDPAEAPASALLKQIEAEKAALLKNGTIRAPKAIPPIADSEKPYTLPGSWEWVRVASLSRSIDYGTSQKTNDNSSLVPVYRMGNIVDGILLNSNLKYISPTIEELPNLYLEDGDILFNRTNSYELVGKSAMYSGDSGVSTFASYLIRVRLMKELLNARFFSLAMNSPYFRETQIDPEIVQQCGQANFNGTKLSLCLLPLPPLEEQKRIVARIDALMRVCDTLEQSIDAAQAKQTELLDAVMARV